MMPKEHGSWAVLIAPLVVGLCAAHGGPVPAVVLFCAAAFGAFLTRTPLQSLLSPAPALGAAKWVGGFSLLAAAGGLPLLFVYGRWGLLGFAAVGGALMAANLRAGATRQMFAFWNEALGVAGLCLVAPAAFYAAGGALTADAWAAWLVCAAYFVGPIFDVKAAALRHRAAVDPSALPARERMRRSSVIYSSVALAGVSLAAAYGVVPGPTPIPFAAALLKTWRRGKLAPGRVDFRRLGFEEVGWSVLFALLVGGGWLLR